MSEVQITVNIPTPIFLFPASSSRSVLRPRVLRLSHNQDTRSGPSTPSVGGFGLDGGSSDIAIGRTRQSPRTDDIRWRDTLAQRGNNVNGRENSHTAGRGFTPDLGRENLNGNGPSTHIQEGYYKPEIDDTIIRGEITLTYLIPPRKPSSHISTSSQSSRYHNTSHLNSTIPPGYSQSKNISINQTRPHSKSISFPPSHHNTTTQSQSRSRPATPKSPKTSFTPLSKPRHFSDQNGQDESKTIGPIRLLYQVTRQTRRPTKEGQLYWSSKSILYTITLPITSHNICLVTGQKKNLGFTLNLPSVLPPSLEGPLERIIHCVYVGIGETLPDYPIPIPISTPTLTSTHVSDIPASPCVLGSGERPSDVYAPDGDSEPSTRRDSEFCSIARQGDSYSSSHDTVRRKGEDFTQDDGQQSDGQNVHDDKGENDDLNLSSRNQSDVSLATYRMPIEEDPPGYFEPDFSPYPTRPHTPNTPTSTPVDTGDSSNMYMRRSSLSPLSSLPSTRPSTPGIPSVGHALNGISIPGTPVLSCFTRPSQSSTPPVTRPSTPGTPMLFNSTRPSTPGTPSAWLYFTRPTTPATRPTHPSREPTFSFPSSETQSGSFPPTYDSYTSTSHISNFTPHISDPDYLQIPIYAKEREREKEKEKEKEKPERSSSFASLVKALKTRPRSNTQGSTSSVRSLASTFGLWDSKPEEEEDNDIPELLKDCVENSQRRVEVVSSLDPRGELRTLLWTRSSYVMGLGRLDLTAQSDLFVLGSSFHFTLSLHSLSPYATLHSLQISLIQTTRTPHAAQTDTFILSHTGVPYFLLDGRRPRGGSHGEYLWRGPKCPTRDSQPIFPGHLITPTSLETGKTLRLPSPVLGAIPSSPHRILHEGQAITNHTLRVEIHFSLLGLSALDTPLPPWLKYPLQKPEGEMRRMWVDHPVHLGHCLCSSENVQVPPYTERDSSLSTSPSKGIVNLITNPVINNVETWESSSVGKMSLTGGNGRRDLSGVGNVATSSGKIVIGQSKEIEDPQSCKIPRHSILYTPHERSGRRVGLHTRQMIREKMERHRKETDGECVCFSVGKEEGEVVEDGGEGEGKVGELSRVG
ncbi:hypothetical protein TREMEDRAFT_62065 [Tremella mesenterica DSM 1558]|uniref:uncharacterized protein n=1 Tax=Tremella mesenterica (strain ATCC 24925 / CBS 8224 / DSM 1558 / NBRC 9311 / NRRL Y-6157 / RJB 2259-6 / UBC 559-6) TaxID=578456 RepID=UPI0003F4A085|nr:uncharacterized protein TREMEDRAFT_62065 [Tremella mesenterica DSM 1558]EIW70302.1 hypothetical protein TREMEDRAFT_62065 [Tremella mesenterica DSM 1558]